MTYRCPQSLHERAKRLAEVHSLTVTASILRLSQATVIAMRKRGWREAPNMQLRPMPADFPLVNATMSRDALASHYSASKVSVSRWRRELATEGRPAAVHRHYDRPERAPFSPGSIVSL